jgi:hypothetical protein
MSPPSSPSDVPFPGAHSQVTGKPLETYASAPPPPGMPRLLRLEASVPQPAERDWVVRLPVRAEHVEIKKRAVVYERVAIRKRAVDDVTRVADDVRREELKVDADGQV